MNKDDIKSIKYYISDKIYIDSMWKWTQNQNVDISCPNEPCIIILPPYSLRECFLKGTHRIDNKDIYRYLCSSYDRACCKHTNTLFNDLRIDEVTIELAIKMAIKKMSYRAIADVLEAQPINVSNWLARAAEKKLKKLLKQNRKYRFTRDRTGWIVDNDPKRIVLKVVEVMVDSSLCHKSKKKIYWGQISEVKIWMHLRISFSFWAVYQKRILLEKYPKSFPA